jgi:hypothetical protein
MSLAVTRIADTRITINGADTRILQTTLYNGGSDHYTKLFIVYEYPLPLIVYEYPLIRVSAYTSIRLTQVSKF